MTLVRPLSSRRGKYYVLGVLTIVYGFTYVDRCLMVLFLQPVKNDLRLSDSQLGFLTGVAFGLFYAALGLPIARWSDRGDRVTISAIAIGLWGMTVTACGLVGTFSQLVVARVAAAVGESGGMPPTYSLVGDYFPAPGERTRAMSIYMLGPSLAALMSFTLGGWVGMHWGWRAGFLLAGPPGLLLAFVLRTTVAEARVLQEGSGLELAVQPTLNQVLSDLGRRPSTRHLALAIILLWTMGLGLQPWYAAFLMRSHGMSLDELGIWLGLANGIGSLLAMPLGGYWVAREFLGDEAGQFRLTGLATAALVPACVLFLLVPGKTQAGLAFVPLTMVFNFLIGPTFAVLQRLVAPTARATTLAAVLLLANLVGMGLGPQLVGVLSDALAPVAATNSLRYAMLLTSLLAFWAAYHFYRVGRTVAADLQAMSVSSEVATAR